MRNLKRALSLTLASVMLLGMMVLGTSAASYPDVNDEHNVEAIEVLQAIGVMSGSNSGNFNPDGKVTRIEMAIVMANLLDLDVDYFQGQNTFSDVPAWASGYVNACAASGIVTGVGSGRFGTGNVTATQAALMMLKALGYFQYNSDFGDDWARATALQASRIRLFDGISVQDNTQLTRNQVAQLALNALQATMVDADDNTLNITTSTGDATTTVQGGKVNYIVRASTDRKVATAISATETGGSSSVTGLNGWTIELGEQLYNGNLVKRDTNAITDEFGRPATEWRLKGEKIGVYNDEPDVTYTKSVKVGVIYKDLGLNRTIPASRVTVYVDGVENSNQTAKAIKGGDDTNKYGDNGILTQVFYDQDADSVVITEINTYTGEIARSVAASGTKDAYVVITTEGNAGERPAGVSGNLNYETDASFDNDVRVLYTYSQSTEEVMSVKVAESVEGTVTRAENSNTNDNDRKALTIDDHRYTASANSAGERTSDVTVKNDYVVYLDAYGYIIYIEESEVAINNYALLINTASNSTFIGNRARLLFTDGTIKNVETEKNYNTGSDKINDYTIVTARVDADGVYTLKAVDSTKSFRNVASHTGADNGALAAADYADTFNMKSDKAGITVDSSAKSYSNAAAATVYNANSATAIVVADAGVDGSGSDFTAYTGIKNAPTITATSDANKGVAAYWFCKSGKMITAMFVFPESALEIEDSSNKLLFISKKSVGNLIHDNVGDYFEYDAVIGTEIAENTKVDETVKVNGVAFANSAATKDTFGGLYKSYTVDKHGIITGVKTYAAWNANSDAEGITTGTGIDKTSKDYTVILDTAGTPKTITVDDAAKIWYVDKDGNISESSYRGISVDDDDTFYAVVKDFLVKTLVIQQVDGSSSAGSVPVAITSDKNSVVVGDNVTLTAKATLGRYDDINGYKWYSSSNSGLTLAQVKRLTPIAGATGETYQPATSTAGTTYYYCIVETTNDRADGVAESYASYELVVKPDLTNSISVVVTYEDNGTQVGDKQVVSVPASSGAGTLTEDLLTLPKYYKLASAWTNHTVMEWDDTTRELDVAVVTDKKNNVAPQMTDAELAAAVDGGKFEDIEKIISNNITQTVADDGTITLTGAMKIIEKNSTNADELAGINAFWWGQEQQDSFFTSISKFFDVAPYCSGKSKIAFLYVTVEDELFFIPLTSADSGRTTYTLTDSKLTTNYTIDTSGLTGIGS